MQFILYTVSDVMPGTAAAVLQQPKDESNTTHEGASAGEEQSQRAGGLFDTLPNTMARFLI